MRAGGVACGLTATPRSRAPPTPTAASRSRSSPASSAPARPRCSTTCCASRRWTGSAVLINEFGAVGVDHHLVEKVRREPRRARLRLHLLQRAGRPGAGLKGLFMRGAAARAQGSAPGADRDHRPGRSGAGHPYADGRAFPVRALPARWRGHRGRCHPRARPARRPQRGRAPGGDGRPAAADQVRPRRCCPTRGGRRPARRC